MEELQNERREYKRSVLKRSKLNADPFTQFSGWVNDCLLYTSDAADE